MAAVSSPLGQQVRQTILERVRSKDWRPGMAIDSIRALANEHDVSAGTVRNVIRDLVTEGVLETVHGKGTFVAKPGASAPARDRIATILLVMPRVPAVDVLRRLALDRDILISHYDTEVDRQDPGTERRLLTMARDNHYLGVIITPTPRPPVNAELFRELRHAGVKVLLTGRYAPEMPSEVYALPDFVGASRMLTGRLAMAGYQRVALFQLGRGEDSIVWKLIQRGFQQAIDELGLTPRELVLPRCSFRNDQPVATSIAQSADELVPRLQQLPDRTGIVCTSPGQAEFLEGLLHLAGRTPNEVGLCTVGRVFAAPAPARITQAVFDLNQIVANALAYVTDASLSPTAPYQHLLPPTYQAGDSTHTAETTS